MKHSLACACACTMTTATAGGLDQSGQPVTLLFRDGNYAEVAVGFWDPTVEGSLGTAGSGNVYGPITDLFGGVKKDFGERLSAALIVDQPYGVNVDYPGGDFPYAGTTADPNSLGVTGLVRWRAGAHVALHGGLRAERIGAEVTLGGPAYGTLAGYEWTGDDDWGVGWVAGASWERPEIGLRVALTYGSEIRHELDSEENFFGASTTEITMPQSVNLDFQTGITPKTLALRLGALGRLERLDRGAGRADGADRAAADHLRVGRLDLPARHRPPAHRRAVGRLSRWRTRPPIDTMKSPLSPYDGYTALSRSGRATRCPRG